jgi:DNA-binding MarR family transcriptional regulator
MSELHTAAVHVYMLAGMMSKFAGQDLERRLQAAGINATALQYGVMQRIQHSSATISELSSSMLLAPATLVPVVDALERKGLVRRGQNIQDRRRKELTLTPNGADLLRRLPPVADDGLVLQALEHMGSEKTRRLLTLLHELVSSVAPEPELVERALARTGDGAGGIAQETYTLGDGILNANA